MDQLAGLTEDARRLALDRFRVLQPHLEQNQSLRSVAQAAGIPYRTAHRWLARYRLFGLAGLARKARDDRGARRAVSTKPADRVALARAAGPSVPLQHDRQRGESIRAFRAYTIYRDLGPGRSLARAYDAYRGAAPHGQRPGQWSLWSVKHRWVKRAGAFDVHVDEAKRKQREMRMIALEERRFDLELENQELLERRVRQMDELLDKAEATPVADVVIVKDVTEESLQSATVKKTRTKTIVKALNMYGYARTVQVRNETAKLAITGVRDVNKKEIADKSVTGIVYRADEDAPPTEIPPSNPRFEVEETASSSLAREDDEDMFGWKKGMDPQKTTCRRCRNQITPPASLKAVVALDSETYQKMMRENTVYSCKSCGEHFCSACIAGLDKVACPACKSAHGW
jgi:hypothetical protein